MHLIGVREEAGWAVSRWELTYPAAWVQIQAGVAAVYDFYDSVQILVNYKKVSVKSADEIKEIEENRNMTVRGFSKIVNVPISITFHNQLSAVDVEVAQASDEFKDVDYEKFNHSLCQYMDSIELAMYR